MVCRHLGQTDPSLSPLAIQVVNDKGRYRQSDAGPRGLTLLGGLSGDRDFETVIHRVL